MRKSGIEIIAANEPWFNTGVDILPLMPNASEALSQKPSDGCITLSNNAMRKRVIFFGIAAAAVLRIAFALLTVQLLQIIGLVLAGGLLLLWVCWKLWRELREVSKANSGNAESKPAEKSVGQAIFQIVLADVSM